MLQPFQKVIVLMLTFESQKLKKKRTQECSFLSYDLVGASPAMGVLARTLPGIVSFVQFPAHGRIGGKPKATSR